MNHRACPSSPLVLATLFAALLAVLPIAATPAAAQTVTVQMRDASGWPTSYYQEFQPITFRVQDSGRAGAGSIEVLVESALRGDEEWLVLTEQPAASGIFSKVLATTATLDPAPPAHSDGTLEVTELAGPPLQRDTLRLSYADCSLSVCPTAQASLYGPTIRLVDSWGYDLEYARPSFSLYIQVTAHFANAQPTLDVTVGDGADSEVVTLQKVAGAGCFNGVASVNYGAAVPGDGLIRVSLGSTLTVSLPEPLGLSQATDRVTIAENRVRYADANGNPAHLLMNGPIPVYYESQAANLSSSSVDTFSVGLASYALSGRRDYETLVLTETGIATGIFTGQQWNEIVSGAGIEGDGLLQAEPQDGIQVSVPGTSLQTPMISGLVRFTDANGADVAEVHPGTVHLELLSYLDNEDENAADEASVIVEISPQPGDQETLLLTEQGVDSNVFRGSITAMLRSGQSGNSLIEGPQGAIFKAYLWLGDGIYDQVQLVADPDNQPPVALGDDVATAEDLSSLADPLANDSDPDQDPLSILAFTQGTHGSVVREPGDPQKLRYTPAANYFGSDSFTYTVSDPGGETATATVAVTVSPVDDPPVAVNDTIFASEDTNVSIQARLNDSDAEGDAIAVVRFDARSAHGTITALSGSFDFRYLADPNWYGTDSFTYEIEAGGQRATATVTVNVGSVPDPPVAVADSATTLEETPVVIAVLANDRDDDGQTFTLYSATASSPATAVANANGTVTYTPGPNVFGSRTFTYRIRDSGGSLSTSATVTVTITNVNDRPVANNDTYFPAEDVQATLAVKSNDTDPDGDVLTVQSVTQGSHGTVTLVDGAVKYLSELNYNGPDSFTYTVADPSGLTATATVNLTVSATNDAPVGVADVVTTAEDTQVIIDALANDIDVDGNTLNFSSWGSPTKGTLAVVSLNGRSQFRYTPNLNTSGSDSFTYRAYDPGGLSTAFTTVSITVTPVNDPPTAVNDAATTAEDTAVTINVLANDSDLEGNPLAVVGYTLGGGATGTVTINPNQTLTYLPGLNYFGTAGFIDYQLSDGNLTATGKVTLNVTPVNDPPIAQPDTVTILEDQVASLFPLANDSDDSAGQMSLQFAFAIINGSSASVNTVTGEATFTPHPNFHGTGSFSYRVQDSTGLTSVGIVTVIVTPVNDAPTAAADAATVAEDGSITVAVLANDGDVDGDSLSITTVGTPQHGSATFGAGGVTYTPAADYNGPDAFSYTISDGNGGTATANLAITVTAVNDAPNAVADAYSVAEDGSGSFPVLANDSDIENQSLTVSAAGGAAHGSVTFSAGGVTYAPAADYSGADSFSYTARDSAGATATATVTVTVTPVDDPPVAVADSASTEEEVAVTVAVLANDSDADGDSLSVVAALADSNGSASFDATSVTFTPAADFSGIATVQYTVSDGNGGTATAAVSITVTAVNDPPVAVADAYTVTEDTPLTFAPLGNDSDPDGDPLSIGAITSVAGGTATATATTISFTPAADFSGSASVQFTVVDGQGGSAASAATIAVSPVNDAPVAVPDAGSVAEDGSLTLQPLANDSDAETPAGLTLTGVSSAAHGAVGFTAGTVVYTPAANYNGADAFSYTVADPQGATSTASVSIVVTAVNDAPVAVGDSAVTTAGSSVTVTVLANDSDLEGATLLVTTVGAPLHGSAVRNADDTVTYTPAAGYSGADSFTYTASDGAASATATVSVTVNDALGQVAVLGLRSLQLETGADVLSGDVVVNAAEPPPFLGATEVAIGTAVTVAAGWDVRGNGVTIAAGATIAADVTSNTLANSGTILGSVSSPLALPVFATLPTLQTATAGSTDVNVAQNGTITLAPGVYRDLLVAKKGVVTFSGGVYVFRSVVIQREAKLLFSAPTTVKVGQRMSTATLTHIKPAPVTTATAATIVFHIAGINGTNGALASTPKPLEIATDNVLAANFYVPNGTLWLQARTVATGAFIGRHVRIGPDVQVGLASAW